MSYLIERAMRATPCTSPGARASAGLTPSPARLTHIAALVPLTPQNPAASPHGGQTDGGPYRGPGAPEPVRWQRTAAIPATGVRPNYASDHLRVACLRIPVPAACA